VTLKGVWTKSSGDWEEVAVKMLKGWIFCKAILSKNAQTFFRTTSTS